MKKPIIIKINQIDDDGTIWCRMYRPCTWCFSKKYRYFGKLYFTTETIDWETWRMGGAYIKNIYRVSFYNAENGGKFFSLTTTDRKNVEWHKNNHGQDIENVEPFIIYETMYGLIPSSDDYNKIKDFLIKCGYPVVTHPYLPLNWVWKFGFDIAKPLYWLYWLLFSWLP